MHLLVDSTGLKPCGSGEWLLEKQGTKARRPWRKPHVAVGADTGQVAAALAASDTDDASQVGPLLGLVAGPIASFTADGAYDQEGRYREAPPIILRRPSSLPTPPRLRGGHLQIIAELGRMAWQEASDRHWRVLAEADTSRFKRVIGDAPRSRTDWRRATEVAVAVNALNRMLEFGRPEYVRLP